MLKIFNTFVFIFIYSCIFTNISLAQTDKPHAIDQKIRYLSQSNVQDRAGDFSLTRSSVSLSSAYKLFNKLPIDLGLRFRNFSINDNTSVDLPDSLQSRMINIGTRFPVPFQEEDRFFLSVDLMPCWKSAENHDFQSDTFRFNSIASLIFKKSDSFVIACGLWIRPEYATSVVSFIGVRFVLFEKLTFEFLSYEPHIAYEVSDKTKLLLEFAFLADEFKVTDGARKGDFVRIQDREIGFGLDHKFNDSFSGRISAGWAFAQEYGYLNSGVKVKPDNTTYLGGKILVRF